MRTLVRRCGRDLAMTLFRPYPAIAGVPLHHSRNGSKVVESRHSESTINNGQPNEIGAPSAGSSLLEYPRISGRVNDRVSGALGVL